MKTPELAIPGQPVSASQFNAWMAYLSGGRITAAPPLEARWSNGFLSLSLGAGLTEIARGKVVTTAISVDSGGTKTAGFVQRYIGFGSEERTYGEPVTVHPWNMADDTSIAIGLEVTIGFDGRNWFVLAAECET